MKRPYWLLLMVSLLWGGMLTSAQTTDDTTTTTEQSTVNYFFAACESQAIIDLTGNMLPGDDVYVQIFREAGGTGEALSPITRVQLSGDYQVSPTIPYNNGATLLTGQFASARISIAPEGNPQSPDFEDTIDDVQDGCIQPTYPAADTSDAGSGSTADGGAINPQTGAVVDVAPGEVITSSGIYTPDGGVLNEIVAEPQEALVQIGPRPSEDLDRLEGRVSDAGLIFAECDAFPLADPGTLYDTDNLTVFWSWFARTPALARRHLETAQYEVFLTSDYAYRQTFPNVNVRPIVRRGDGNYYIFYVANLGDGFRPGEYQIDYYVTWSEPISDGYDEFGPGTDNPFLINTCTFEVEPNPFDVEVERNNPTIPLQQGK